MDSPFRTVDLATLSWTLTGTRAAHAPDSNPGPDRIGPLPARLPGCVHTALISAGLIGDPRSGFHELTQQWIGVTDWVFKASFSLDSQSGAHTAHELVIDGLDTTATIRINGAIAGQSANVHHEHRFSISHLIHEGPNEIEIHFEAPLCEIRRREQELGARPVNGDWDPFIFMRKAACNFGWDWGPKVATCGIWKYFRIESRSTPRIQSVRPHLRLLDANRWQAQIDVSLADLPAHTTLHLRATIDGGVETAEVCTLPFSIRPTAAAAACPEQRVTLHIENPARWHPRRHGAAACYRLTVELITADGTPLSTWQRLIGFRDLKLHTTPDPAGSGRSLTFIVNGQPIFCIGVNWIPSDLLPGLEEVSPLGTPTLTALLDRCIEANWNMIRIWGGGTTESDAFYEWCDTHGVMIWQDFMFACAMYPEEPPFPALVEAEARAQVTHLASHPSIVLWCGGNECIWGYESWGWKQRLLPGQYWGAGFYHTMLPRIVDELDPTRPYWANSPWSGDEQLHPNDAAHGDRHTWEVKLEDYRTIPSRFCSEFGHQSPSALSTLRAALSETDLQIGSRAMEHRQRGPGGNAAQYDQALSLWYTAAANFEEWHYQAQMIQARAMQIAFESCRVNAPFCMGALVWQLNDVWPGLTWSLIDVRGIEKLAFTTSLRAASTRLIVLDGLPNSPSVTAAALNDTDEVFVPKVRLLRLSSRGEVLASLRIIPKVRPRSVCTFSQLDAVLGPLAQDEYYAAVREDGSQTPAIWMPIKDRTFAYQPPRVTVELDGAALRLRAQVFIRDLVPLDETLRQKTSSIWPATLLAGDTLELPGDLASAILADSSGLLDRTAWMCANWFTDRAGT
ncbi:MAG: hypothetical protein NTV94_19325 [Planctomycetota bacterium]|nr:hypothetical protein [Planctomycetota bacterium]